MKYIGATDFFVRAPFVIEGMLIGAVGAGIPLGLIYLLYNKIVLQVYQQIAAAQGFRHNIGTPYIPHSIHRLQVCLSFI